MPYSTACATSLSNFEAGLNYKDVSDPAVMATFPLVGDKDGAAMIAWTTTPWTLPSNLALCVNPELVYVRARDAATGKVYIAAEACLPNIPGAVAKKGAKGGWEVLSKCTGAELKGLQYEPLFDYFKSHEGAFRVQADNYVTSDAGTGVVHLAPAFGEDDHRVCMENHVIRPSDPLPCPVDHSGRFTDPVAEHNGVYIKDAEKAIIAAIKAKGRLFNSASLVHSYPFCWRSDTPLIYKAVPSWFVRVEQIKERLLHNNTLTRWVPAVIQEKRFHNWLENARDWAISRSRFWGTPIPVWASEDFEEIVVVGSREELEKLSGVSGLTDIHRHFIDEITIPSKKGKGVLRRIDDVFDCWFESGSMPYAHVHYPFERKEAFEANFPADFVAEGLDQTRGWFYTLMVLSTALFDKPAFKNLICTGLVLAADGRKMSKRLKNYPDPNEVIDKYGSDALRLYLLDSPVVRAETLRFKEEGVFAVLKDVFLPWYNAYRFLVQAVQGLEADTGKAFDPRGSDWESSGNVLDRWIVGATNSLVKFVHTEMEAYRLYTVVPELVRYIDRLTNVYVRFNRKRLKGQSGDSADTALALKVLYHVILRTCMLMAPFTPFLTESMFLNLRRSMPEQLPESVHFCDIPAASGTAEDPRVKTSVERMLTVIELVRVIR